MTKQHINPPSVFRSLDFGFPQGVATTGRRTLYVSGQTAWDADRRLVGGSDLAAAALADPAFLIEVEAIAVFD